MVEELLICLIFLSQSNADISSEYLAVETCLNEGGEKLSNGKACIPRKHLTYIQWDPVNPGKTEIQIRLSNVQVIDIGSNVITVSMNTRIKWKDHRLELGVKKVILSMEDQKQLWSPNIVIGTNMMSKSKEDDEFQVKKYANETTIYHSFYLHTTVKCEMDFQKFPFDKHNCYIEVSW